jgi:integrase
MAQYTQRGPLQWRVKVRRKGFPEQSRTFEYKEDAEKWARALENELATTGFIDRRSAEKNSFRQVLEKYRTDVTPSKKSKEIEAIKIGVILKDSVLVDRKMAAVSVQAVAAWRDRRLKQVSSGTVNREMDILSAAMNHARREWGINVVNPIQDVKRPPKSRSRTRRFSAIEEEYLLAALGEGKRNDDGTFGKCARNPWLSPLVRLAVETAMRRGELLSLDWQHVDLERQTAHLPDTKNGDARTVPLSRAAVAILKSLPRKDDDPEHEFELESEPVFPTSAMALRKGFGRALVRAKDKYLSDCKESRVRPARGFLEDVHFHDTRHEAASRLAEKLPNVLELSAVTGHKDLRSLKRYYHPRAEDLAKKLG